MFFAPDLLYYRVHRTIKRTLCTAVLMLPDWELTAVVTGAGGKLRLAVKLLMWMVCAPWDPGSGMPAM